MGKKWVIIRVETKVREFRSKALLAYHLIHKGYGVILQNRLGENVKYLPVGVYITNSIYKNSEHLIRKIKKRGHKIVFLDEEGLLCINRKKYLERLDSKSMMHIDKVLCFGETQKETTLTKFPESKVETLVTGNPRFNLLNQMFSKLDATSRNKLSHKYGKYILVVSNFSFVNMQGSCGDKENRRDRTKMQLAELGLLENCKEFKEQFDYYERLFQAFIKMCSSLSKVFPEHMLIIRPHPSENPRPWQRIQERNSNVRVIFEGPLSLWISASSLVIQNGCTSALESMYLDIPCISYMPITNHIYDQPLPAELSVKVQTVEEVISIATKALKSDCNMFSSEYEVFRDKAKRYISFQDRDDSIIQICKAIETCQIPKCSFDSKKFQRKQKNINKTKKLCSSAKTMYARLVREAMKVLKLTNNNFYSLINRKIQLRSISKEYEYKKAGTLEPDEITKLFADLDSIYHNNTVIEVEDLSKNLILIKQKDVVPR